MKLRKMRSPSWLGLVLALTLVAGACSSTPATTTTEGATPATEAPQSTTAPEATDVTEATMAPDTTPPAPEKDSVRIVIASTPDFTQIALSQWQEDLENTYGLDVELSNVEASDVALRAVVAGAADVYVGSITPLVRLVKETGEDLKVIAVDSQATDYVVLSQPEFATIDELIAADGQFGINRPGDAGESVTRAALTRAGYDPDAVDYVQIGGTSARVAALLSGQIDAGAAHAAEAFTAVEEGGLNALIVAGDLIGAYLQTGLITSGDFLDENPILAQLLVDSFIDSNRWAADDKAAYIAKSIEIVPELSDSARDQAYDAFLMIDLFAVNGGLSESSLAAFLEIELESGSLTEVPDIDLWADLSYVEDYLKRNGTR